RRPPAERLHPPRSSAPAPATRRSRAPAAQPPLRGPPEPAPCDRSPPTQSPRAPSPARSATKIAPAKPEGGRTPSSLIVTASHPPTQRAKASSCVKREGDWPQRRGD